MESWSGAFEYWSGVLDWNSIIINFHTNCIIYQPFNMLSEYLCSWRNCSILSTCATRAGRGVGTMWLTGLFLNLFTDIVRTETAGLPMELFIQPVSHSIDKL